MILLVYTSVMTNDLQQQLGRPEYSYRFVVREFRPLLDKLGTVIDIKDPEREVDAIHAQCVQRGEACIFLCFMPPNKVPIGLACPTIPVFAWEYEALPDEAFGGKPRNDWRRVLSKFGMALTHSSFTAARTRAALGGGFPITSVPAPLWDRMQTLRRGPSAYADQIKLLIADGLVIDSRKIRLSDYRKTQSQEAMPEVLALPETGLEDDALHIEGVIYTAIFNPHDGRKNWVEMLMAFCSALREKPDATLLVKLTHHDPSALIPDMLEILYKMGTMACRVVLIHAFLDGSAYDALLHATTYAVNTSHGEGQCLPLMEYMSAGKPALAPRHTSMLDYIDDDSSFVIDSSDELGTWPHDKRQAFRTLRKRIHFHSLVQAFQQSYYVAIREPEVYAAMSNAAIRSLKRYCSMDVVLPRLRNMLEQRLRSANDAYTGSPAMKKNMIQA